MSILSAIQVSFESANPVYANTSPVFDRAVERMKSRTSNEFDFSMEAFDKKSIVDWIKSFLGKIRELIKRFMTWISDQYSKLNRNMNRGLLLLTNSSYRKDDRLKKEVRDALKKVHAEHSDALGSKLYLDTLKSTDYDYSTEIEDRLNVKEIDEILTDMISAKDKQEIKNLLNRITVLKEDNDRELEKIYNEMTEPRGLGPSPETVFDIEDHKRYELGVNYRMKKVLSLNQRVETKMNSMEKTVSTALQALGSVSEDEETVLRAIASYLTAFNNWFTKFQKVVGSVFKIDQAVVAELTKTLRTSHTAGGKNNKLGIRFRAL